HYAPSLEVCSLSLHDALPISGLGTGYARSGLEVGAARVARRAVRRVRVVLGVGGAVERARAPYPSGRRDAAPRGRRHRDGAAWRSEEHTSELQSRFDLVCRLL